MSTKECCRTCQHCNTTENSIEGWCRLRQLSVSYELAKFALCHHWTEKAPSLPTFDEQPSDVLLDKQLELVRYVLN